MEKISLQKIKWLRSLQLKKNRDREEIIVIEGEKIVSELLEYKKEQIIFILCSERLYFDLNLSKISDVYLGSCSDLEKVTLLKSAPEIIALIKKPITTDINTKDRLLILDGIQDPGNLGTIIRTADWFGIKQIVCSKNSVDCFNQKVIQSSMGSVFRISVSYLDLPQFIKDLNCPIHGALLNGKNIKDVNPNEIKVLVLGNEGQGISEEVSNLINHPTTIPGYGNAESLNVAIAGGIFMNHWRI